MNDKNTVVVGELKDAVLSDRVSVVGDRPDSEGVAATATKAGVSMLLALAAQLSADRRDSGIARDRVLIPEVRVSDVTNAVAGLRPRILGAVANTCGAGARRLNTAQQAIRSRIVDES
jgi:hypothetical protein